MEANQFAQFTEQHSDLYHRCLINLQQSRVYCLHNFLQVIQILLVEININTKELWASLINSSLTLIQTYLKEEIDDYDYQTVFAISKILFRYPFYNLKVLDQLMIIRKILLKDLNMLTIDQALEAIQFLKLRDMLNHINHLEKFDSFFVNFYESLSFE